MDIEPRLVIVIIIFGIVMTLTGYHTGYEQRRVDEAEENMVREEKKKKKG